MAAISRTNSEWVSELGIPGSPRNKALEDLRQILIRGLRSAFRGQLSRRDREFSELFDDFAQEALVKIVAGLDSFQGLSQFTTWAHKICIRIAFAELRRLRWKDVSLDAMLDSGKQPEVLTSEPDASGDRKDMLTWMTQAIKEELTEKQRMALQAIAFGGIPMDELARRMGTNRNALYKLLHDARLRLKQRLARDGMGPAS